MKTRKIESKVVMQLWHTGEGVFAEMLNTAYDKILQEHRDAKVTTSVTSDAGGRLAAVIQYEYEIEL